MTAPLPQEFYARDTLTVARHLLGCTLVHEGPEGLTSGRIVEVEAYQGEDDPACHAAVGRTERTEPLYGPPGFSYVYLIYGMYHCLNAVTRDEGQPSAVLIRAIEPLEGVDLMRARREAGRGRTPRRGKRGVRLEELELGSGPGKLCEALGLTLRHNRLDLSAGPLRIERGEVPAEIAWTPRVGIAAGTDRVWRCFVLGSPFVSRSHLNRITTVGPKPAAV